MGLAAVTHYVDWDAPGRVKVRALCGIYIRRREHTNAPTCDICRQALDARARLDEIAWPKEDPRWR